MSAARTVTWAAILLIPAILWGVLNHAKNDLVAKSRYVVERVHEVGGENEKARVSFFQHYHLPMSHRTPDDFVFDRFWFQLLDCEPREIAYLGKPIRRRGEDGNDHNGRLISIDGAKRDGEATTLVLDWEQYRGSWYLRDIKQDGVWGLEALGLPD